MPSSIELEAGAPNKWLGSVNGDENESSENIPQPSERSPTTSPQSSQNFIGRSIRVLPSVQRIQDKQNSSANNENDRDDNEDGGSDSDIEFLLTILPPSPCKPKTKPRAELPSAIPSPEDARMNHPSASMKKSSGLSSCSFTPQQHRESTFCCDHESTNDNLSSCTTGPLHKDCDHTQDVPANSRNQVLVPTMAATCDIHTNLLDDQRRTDSYPISPSQPSSIAHMHRDVDNGAKSKAAPKSPDDSVHRRSAYLQSLAEICHDILWDARWRVGAQHQRLLAWEKGDDLSVVCTLAEQYIPIEVPKAHSRNDQVTKDLQVAPTLEGEKKCQNESIDDTAGVTTTATETKRSNESGLGSFTEMRDSGFSAEGVDANSGKLEEDAHNRRLNLYCRLYYRKGPFFRVDDVFDRYYSPKRNKNEIDSTVLSTSAVPTDMGTEKIAEQEQIKKDERQDFFRPQKKKKTDSLNTSGADVHSRNRIDENALLDMDMLHRQLDYACLLVKDWTELQNMGFLRTFSNEEECGKTVGLKNGILTQDDQNRILQLLGCKKKSLQRSQSGQNTKSNSPIGSENLVWKQMVHQATISFAASPEIATRRNSVLPVVKHVNATILECWAKSIVLKASKKDYIPTSNLQSLTTAVKSKLLEVIRSLTGLDVFSCCLRLREPPLNTLRRCFRLYLCATSGPGSMRGDDNTAWKSLPESHSKDLTKLPFQRLIPPPGSNCWNKISCPGKDYRFKIASCNFRGAHEPLDLQSVRYCAQKYDWKLIQVFPTIESFSMWELTVELRAHVDYLMTLKDLLRYNERRRLRLQTDEQGDEDNESATVDLKSVTVDFHDLRAPKGREKMFQKLCVDLQLEHSETIAILRSVENDVEKLEAGFAVGDIKPGLHVECDKVLSIIGIIVLHTLAACSARTSEERLLLYQKRPWLRHLCWEGCLAYILWDTIKTLECKLDGFYQLAVKALNVLLFGQAAMPSELSFSTMHEAKLMPLLLSRRAKGKAYERLVVDYLHHLRQKRQKEDQHRDSRMIQDTRIPNDMRRRKINKSKQNAKKDEPTPNEEVANFSQLLIQVCVHRGQIPFSAIRTIARRLKRPLTKTLAGIVSPETVELGHRYSNDSSASSATNDRCYSDWTPTTDYAVANAVATNDDLVGKRCSYVGFEDNVINMGSLNVEELAMEFYRTGRLPITVPPAQRGGWSGWHDEGGKVRQLWRILSSAGVLGMDFGSSDNGNIRPHELATIHLTPYQSAPFDLHCGAEMDFDMVARRGFYERRKSLIDGFLNQISSLQPSEVADLVHFSVETRLLFASGNSDPTLRRDIEQVRSLSLLAAGIGGKLLSAIFRCFFYDYRHYIGGLPDLTLVRAVSKGNIVDLGELVGEGFRPDHQKAENMLEDRDSEFLGCTKVGDSGVRNINQMRRGQRRDERWKDNQSAENWTMPPKLELTWKGNPVTVECMFAEVKSANDRLDVRQEDWLNILDIHGNARVCKFGAKVK